MIEKNKRHRRRRVVQRTAIYHCELPFGVILRKDFQKTHDTLQTNIYIHVSAKLLLSQCENGLV